MYTFSYASPLGGITVQSNGTEITGLWFEGQRGADAFCPSNAPERNLPVFGRAREWLDLYFDGKNPGFLPPLSMKGTPFRQTVWNILLSIPYGQTVTYGEIAKQIAREQGKERMSAQAVGGAVGHNPISLMIPCHRVVGSGGKLTGYAGGIEKKEWLLDLERANRQADPYPITR